MQGKKSIQDALGDLTVNPTFAYLSSRITSTINSLEQDSLDGRNSVRTAIVTKDEKVIIPNNPSFQDLVTGVGQIDTGVIEIEFSNVRTLVNNELEDLGEDGNVYNHYLQYYCYSYYDGFIYLFYGSLFKKFNPITKTWTNLKYWHNTGTVDSNLISFKTGNKLYAVHPQSNSEQLGAYDITTNTWTILNSSFPASIYNDSKTSWLLFPLIISNHFLGYTYITGSSSDNRVYYYRFDLETNLFSKFTEVSMYYPPWRLRAKNVGKFSYFIGYNPVNTSATVALMRKVDEILGTATIVMDLTNNYDFLYYKGNENCDFIGNEAKFYSIRINSNISTENDYFWCSIFDFEKNFMQVFSWDIFYNKKDNPHPERGVSSVQPRCYDPVRKEMYLYVNDTNHFWRTPFDLENFIVPHSRYNYVFDFSFLEEDITVKLTITDQDYQILDYSVSEENTTGIKEVKAGTEVIMKGVQKCIFPNLTFSGKIVFEKNKI